MPSDPQDLHAKPTEKAVAAQSGDEFAIALNDQDNGVVVGNPKDRRIETDQLVEEYLALFTLQLFIFYNVNRGAHRKPMKTSTRDEKRHFNVGAHPIAFLQVRRSVLRFTLFDASPFRMFG